MIGQAYLRYVKSQASLPWQKKKEKKLVDYTTVFVPGKVYWAKVVGEKALHDNYDKQFGGENPGRQWQYELVPDDVSFLKDHRLLDRLKDKEDEKNPDKGDFLILKKPEFTKDGVKNDPIEIYDADNSDWDDRLLGNGTRVIAKLTIADFGKGKKKAIWTNALRVEELVPHEGGGGAERGFGGYDGGTPKGPPKGRAKPPAKKADPVLDDLDDDVPF